MSRTARLEVEYLVAGRIHIVLCRRAQGLALRSAGAVLGERRTTQGANISAVASKDRIPQKPANETIRSRGLQLYRLHPWVQRSDDRLHE